MTPIRCVFLVRACWSEFVNLSLTSKVFFTFNCSFYTCYKCVFASFYTHIFICDKGLYLPESVLKATHFE